MNLGRPFLLLAYSTVCLLTTSGLAGCTGARTSRISPDITPPPGRDRGINPRIDRGPPRIDKGPPPKDWGPPPLDWSPPPLDWAHDFPGYPDAVPPCSSKIGTPCALAGSCCPGLQCISLASGARVCSTTCTPDDPATPLVNEDSCKFNYRCANIEPQTGLQYACLPICKPVLGSTSCAPGLACNPASNMMSGQLNTALCAHLACKTGEDCPVRTAVLCSVGSPNACAGLPPNTFCAPDDLGSPAGRCALPGNCEPKSGLCIQHKLGKPNAKIGNSCKDDRDCGAAMFCLMQQTDASGKQIYRNGYCSQTGCAFGNTLKHTICPSASICHLLYPGGQCFKTCDLNDKKGCRDVAKDTFGDYECYAWNNLAAGGQQIAKDSTCEPAIYTCDFLGGAGLDCSILGLQNNPSKMRCRDRVTGATLPATSPAGLCLDDTASGP